MKPFKCLRKGTAALFGALAGLAVMAAGTAPVLADTYQPPVVKITDGTVEPMPIAVTNFLGDDEDAARLGREIADVVRLDLKRSGLFSPIDRRAFIEKIENFDMRPRFGDWRVIDAQVLVTGRAVRQSDGDIRVDFHLWDVYAERNLIGYQIRVPEDLWRRAAHVVADQVYEKLTGEQGYFDTRVVFISESGPKTDRVKRLTVMDQDGANPMFLTDGAAMVLTPRFSPTRQEIVYLSYATGLPRVHLRDIESGREEVVGEFPGMTFAPRFSPDGNKVIMSLVRGDNTDVYVMDLRTRVTRRLTSHPAIDTAPSYSPDGRYVTFESDRGGSQQIYVMKSDGTSPQRISFGEGRYGTPVWSPRGDLIAFTKIWRGTFYIGVMRPDGKGERLLTESFLEEGPTWSPNGRVLMFFRTEPTRADLSGGNVSLWSVDVTGHNQRLIPTIDNASDPAWSPSLSDGMLGE